jgi:hypothetical protein
MHVDRRVILPTDSPIRALALIYHLQLHPPPPVEPTLYLLPLSRTTEEEGSIMLLWRKLQMLSLVCFFINATTAVGLFDFGASHSFIFDAYVEKHNLSIALLKCQMLVSSPGGDMPTRQLCPKVNFKIKGVDFVTNHIVLESKGIDDERLVCDLLRGRGRSIGGYLVICHTPVLKSTESKPPYVCPGCFE